MSKDQVIHHLLVSKSEATAKVEAPIESVDLAEWVLNLSDAEYQRCAPGEHLAAGRTTTDDGRPMSINVEEVGGSLAIQHYVAEIHEPTTASWCRCPMCRHQAVGPKHMSPGTCRARADR